MESGAASVGAISKDGDPKADAVRGRSTIEFPYMDQDAALAVAVAVHTIGGVSCDWNQLAAQMKQSAAGGGFRLRVITAKVFGLLAYERGTVTLTDVGIRAVDDKHARRARVESFLAVPLFKAVFDKLAGSNLPPAAAIERLMEQLGVAPKQKKSARQVFMRSAKQAGFLAIDPDRLTLPPSQHSGGQSFDQRKTEIKDKNGGGQNGRGAGGNDGGDGSKIPAAILGLLEKLPEAGTRMSAKKRASLVAAFTATVGYIYPDSDEE